jgi:uncharacterized membrane protein
VRVVQILGMLFYPLIVHLLIELEVPWLAVTGLVVTSLVYLLLVIGFQRRTGAHPAWLLLYVAISALGVANLLTATHYSLYVPPVVINFGIGLAFAATLRAGRAPLVVQMMRFEYGGDLPPAPLQAYGRRLTLVWAVYFIAMSLVSLLLAFIAPLTVWSLFTNVLHYVLAITLLFAQFLYRFWRYRQHGVFMPWDTLRAMGRVAPSGGGPAPK